MEDMAARAEALAQTTLLARLIRALWTSRALSHEACVDVFEDTKAALLHPDPHNALAKAAVVQLDALKKAAVVPR